ncbi:hypothetical protein NPIL_558641 [Nephila pilipes]|uniref:Uncharacterized protein n=1 Tax=Nephila pilipes TaxID=299642 RepID=A0A8X6MC48_NEPPI|nr:hypothetical protein NPIL_558641 [Nephila pilipes]
MVFQRYETEPMHEEISNQEEENIDDRCDELKKLEDDFEYTRTVLKAAEGFTSQIFANNEEPSEQNKEHLQLKGNKKALTGKILRFSPCPKKGNSYISNISSNGFTNER